MRTDKIDASCTVTLRHDSRLHHIGLGRRLAGTRVYVLTADLHVRVIALETGELLRDLSLDPSRDYQPTGRRVRAAEPATPSRPTVGTGHPGPR